MTQLILHCMIARESHLHESALPILHQLVVGQVDQVGLMLLESAAPLPTMEAMESPASATCLTVPPLTAAVGQLHEDGWQKMGSPASAVPSPLAGDRRARPASMHMAASSGHSSLWLCFVPPLESSSCAVQHVLGGKVWVGIYDGRHGVCSILVIEA